MIITSKRSFDNHIFKIDFLYKYCRIFRVEKGVLMDKDIRVVELFAGVGGFRLGLEKASSRYKTVMANQWEPAKKKQVAGECYAYNFDYQQVGDDKEEYHKGESILWVRDINELTDKMKKGDKKAVPEHDLLVGGFPCQDYSVAKPNTQSHGLQGKKGVLWWNIYDILKEKRPKAVFLENVDRLLKSPSKQRGRDFAVILSTMSDLGYTVEWQVVNAADYGFPQRRRRVFIVGLLEDNSLLEDKFKKGIIGETLPFTYEEMIQGNIEGNPWEITENFNKDGGDSPFSNRGVLRNREYITGAVKSIYNGKKSVLGELLEPLSDVPDDFITDPARWKYTKGAKDEERIKSDGFRYRYKEGAVPFPDSLDKPARTILTSEGGSSPSRTTHCILQDGKYRRLTPKELERLNGFPDDWTKNMNKEEETTNTMRGFLMGNALVIGVIEKIGEALEKRL